LVHIPRPEQFQSAPPAKGAISGMFDCRSDEAVSIRAPREGGDAYISKIR